jgi:hypothetical protein
MFEKFVVGIDWEERVCEDALFHDSSSGDLARLTIWL